MTARDFSTTTVLAAYTGRVFADKGKGVSTATFGLISYLFEQSARRDSNEADFELQKKVLEREVPWLAEIKFAPPQNVDRSIRDEYADTFLANIKAKHGETVTITQLPANDPLLQLK